MVPKWWFKRTLYSGDGDTFSGSWNPFWPLLRDTVTTKDVADHQRVWTKLVCTKTYGPYISLQEAWSQWTIWCRVCKSWFCSLHSFEIMTTVDFQPKLNWYLLSWSIIINYPKLTSIQVRKVFPEWKFLCTLLVFCFPMCCNGSVCRL